MSIHLSSLSLSIMKGLKDIKGIPALVAWSEEDKHGEDNFPPSIVEPCHNLSLEELVRDYSRGIVHPESSAIYDSDYDDSDEIREVNVPEDISEVLQPAFSSEAKPRTKRSEAGKPSDTRNERSEVQSNDGSGAEAKLQGEGSGE